MSLITSLSDDEDLGGETDAARGGQRVQPGRVLSRGMSAGRDDERDAPKQARVLRESPDDCPGTSGEADRSRGVVLLGHGADFGRIAFGLAADAREGFEVAGRFVGKADLRASDSLGVPHPVDEVLALTARREQRHGLTTAALYDTQGCLPDLSDYRSMRTFSLRP